MATIFSTRDGSLLAETIASEPLMAAQIIARSLGQTVHLIDGDDERIVGPDGAAQPVTAELRKRFNL
jgi:hypothetical protein